MSGARRLVLSGVALTALLALVAVASHAHRPGGGSGGGSAHAPKLLFEYAASIMFVLFPIGVFVVLWAMSLRRRQRLLEGGSGRRQFLGLLVLVLLALPLALLVRYYVGRENTSVNPPQLPKPGSGATGRDALHRAHGAQAQFQWLPAVVLISLLLALVAGFVGALVWRRRRGGDWDHEAALTAALDEVLADTLDDLRAERDPRKAVIAAFKRLERTFAAHDVPREEAETPREYVDRALDRLGVSASSVGRLTALYERAKFSRHEIDATMKDDAIEALAGVRSELETKPEEWVAA